MAEPLELKYKVIMYGLTVLTLILLVVTVGTMWYINSDLNSIARMEFADECRANNGIALEARQSVNRWPALYCVSEISLVDKQILNPPSPLD